LPLSQELKNLCLEHDEKASLKNLAIELNSFKFSQNATYEDVNCGAVLAVGERVAGSEELDLTSTGAVLGAFKKEFTGWNELFKKCCPRNSDQVGIIYGIERVVNIAKFEDFRKAKGFRLLLQTIHSDENEVLTDEALGIWKEKRSSGEGGEVALEMFKDKAIQDFLEWVEQSEEEDSSSSEEEDSD